MPRPACVCRQKASIWMRLVYVVACLLATERAFDTVSAQNPLLLHGVGQELVKAPLDGPLGHWQPDSPDVKSLDKLAFFLSQGSNRTKACIACRPQTLPMPVHLRAPTLDEWTMDDRRTGPHMYGRPNIGDPGSMQLVAMQVALTNIGTIDAVAGTFEAAYEFDFHWNVSQVNITTDPACAFPCDATKHFCCDGVWVPRLRVANAKGRPLAKSALVPFNTARPTSGLPVNYTMLHWNVQLEGLFNFDLDDRIFPLDQQRLELTLVNPYPSTTYFHYMQPETTSSSSVDGWSRRALPNRAAFYNSRLQPRVNVAGPPTAAGWRIKALTVARECHRSVLPIYIRDINEYLTIVSQQANTTDSDPFPDKPGYEDQSIPLGSYISSNWDCPVFDNDMTNDSYVALVNQTYNAYMQCANNSFRPDSYPDQDADAMLSPVNMTCLLDSVAHLTTPTISVIITVRRATAYYLVKLVVPMAVCVYIAFTAFALQVEDLGARLAVVVPAAVALTALQILVVATDVQAGACIIPTTSLMLCSYASQLLTAVSCTLTYGLWVGQNLGEKIANTPNGQQGQGLTTVDRRAHLRRQGRSLLTMIPVLETRVSAAPGSPRAAAQPGARYQNGDVPHREPRGWCWTRCMTLVISWWLENQLPIRVMDLILGLIIVVGYSLALILCLAIPAGHMHKRNVNPLGALAQTFPK